MSDAPIRIKLVGDTTKPATLAVIDAASGRTITNVIAVDCHLSRVPADCQVTLTFWGVELELEASATAVPDSETLP